MTRGRRLLLGVLQLTSGREVAARCGVVASCVSEWLGGYARPSDVPRMRLQSIYGISAASWGGGRVVRTCACRRKR